MAGAYLPLHPMEHQYSRDRGTRPRSTRLGREHPHVMDPAGESYLRQEGRGLCIGFYEQTCRPWAVDGDAVGVRARAAPPTISHKIEASIEFAYRRFPVLERAGVKSVIHGPFTFAPDGNPLVRPGCRACATTGRPCGVMAGVFAGGGVGLMLAQWMVEGETERDVMAMGCPPASAAGSGRATRLPKGDRELPDAVFGQLSERRRNRPPGPSAPTPMFDTFDALGAVWGPTITGLGGG